MAFPDIFDIMAGQRWAPPAGIKLTGSDTQDNCHNYRLIGSNDCGDVTNRTLYFDIEAFSPIEYEKRSEGYRNGAGLFVKNFQRKDPYVVFEVLITDQVLHKLEDIEQSTVITIEDLVNANTETVVVMKIDASEEALLNRVRISILLEGTSQIYRSCCGGLFDGSEHDPCDPAGPITDPSCVSYAVMIALTTSPDVLTASTSGGPVGGTESFSWSADYNGNGVYEKIPGAIGPTYQPTVPASYQVTAFKGVCIAVTQFSYNGTCTGYEVTLQLIGDLLIATANLLTNSWEWFLDAVSQGTTAVPYYTVDGTGDWTVEGTTPGACTDLSPVVPATYVDCGAWAIMIARVDNILTASHDCVACGTPSYQWAYDDGTGIADLSGETNTTLDVSGGRGLYRVAVTIDGCTKYLYELVLDDCVMFKAFIQSLTEFMPPTYARLQAASYNPPNGASVSYEWYKKVDDAWELAFSGNPFDLDEKRAVKLVATAGLCTKEEELYFCVDPAGVTPYESFNGTGTEVEFAFSAFTPPYPVDQGGTETANDIDGDYLVTRDGIRLHYVPLADLAAAQPSENDRTAYSWDYSNSKIELPTGWPMAPGERLSATKLR